MSERPNIFHSGELALQRRAGVAERVDSYAHKMIRDHMPLQHQTFYQQLPMLFLGFSDHNDDVWASVVAGEAGFLSTPSDRSLSIANFPSKSDPLGIALAKHTEDPTVPLRLGVLGIELSTRRRNRMSAQLAQIEENGFALEVVQTFGNCPQYIQTRELVSVEPMKTPAAAESIEAFDNQTQDFLRRADTFFVASSTQRQANDAALDPSQGADVSHRGGQPGFIRVDDNVTLTIPDYSGNNHFNTLGNIAVNPKVGLLFIDFQTGDLYSFTGNAKILWDHPDQQHFLGAERLWQFTLHRGVIQRAALPYRFAFEDWSPNTLMTGTWQQADQAARQTREQWKVWEVSKVERESASICSFYLDPPGSNIPTFLPGQFLTVKVSINGQDHIRNYSVSSAPRDDFVRISVKDDGLVSHWLHKQLKVGATLLVKPPQGQFVLDEESQRPAVLLSAGVGITPLLSMYRHLVKSGTEQTTQRSVLMINAFKNKAEQAFFDEVSRLTAASQGRAKNLWMLSQPQEDAVLCEDYHGRGRISKSFLQRHLPIDSYDFYLCGPQGFMQDMYDMLLELGVQDADIKAEAFGPASLKRQQVTAETVQEAPPAAETAMVTFKRSGVEQAWHQEDGTLLEFSESHGLSPEFGCRNGTCGSCKVKVLKGQVSHNSDISFPIEHDEVLLCSARPAQRGEDIPVLVLDA